MKITGAIFDLDGTLLDSMFIWDNIGKDYLLSLGITPKEDLDEILKPLSLKQAAEYLQCEYKLKAGTEEIISGINNMITDFYSDTVLPKEGVLPFLQHLKNKGIKMCIATATDRHLAESALKRTLLSEFFSEIFTCGSVGFGKDNPTIYNAALNHLGTNKDTTVVFEDAIHAISTAKKEGYFVVGVYDNSEQCNAEKIKDMSDIYIHSFHEMRAYID